MIQLDWTLKSKGAKMCSYTPPSLFFVFLKTIFSSTVFNCGMDDLPLTSSDRTEIFTTDTLKYPPEVESSILISVASIRIRRVLNAKKPVFQRTFRYFFYKKKRKWDFWKSSKLPLRYSRRYPQKNFQPNRTKFYGVVQCQDEPYEKSWFSRKPPKNLR